MKQHFLWISFINYCASRFKDEKKCKKHFKLEFWILESLNVLFITFFIFFSELFLFAFVDTGLLVVIKLKPLTVFQQRSTRNIDLHLVKSMAPSSRVDNDKLPSQDEMSTQCKGLWTKQWRKKNCFEIDEDHHNAASILLFALCCANLNVPWNGIPS